MAASMGPAGVAHSRALRGIPLRTKARARTPRDAQGESHGRPTHGPAERTRPDLAVAFDGVGPWYRQMPIWFALVTLIGVVFLLMMWTANRRHLRLLTTGTFAKARCVPQQDKGATMILTVTVGTPDAAVATNHTLPRSEAQRVLADPSPVVVHAAGNPREFFLLSEYPALRLLDENGGVAPVPWRARVALARIRDGATSRGGSNHFRRRDDRGRRLYLSASRGGPAVSASRSAEEIVRLLVNSSPAWLSALERVVGVLDLGASEHDAFGLLTRPALDVSGPVGILSPFVRGISLQYVFDIHHERPYSRDDGRSVRDPALWRHTVTLQIG